MKGQKILKRKTHHCTSVGVFQNFTVCSEHILITEFLERWASIATAFSLLSPSHKPIRSTMPRTKFCVFRPPGTPLPIFLVLVKDFNQHQWLKPEPWAPFWNPTFPLLSVSDPHFGLILCPQCCSNPFFFSSTVGTLRQIKNQEFSSHNGHLASICHPLNPKCLKIFQGVKK